MTSIADSKIIQNKTECSYVIILYSKADQSFSAKIAPKWKGSYRILRKVGPINFEIVLEDSGEDFKVVNVAQLNACYPTAEELDKQQHRRVLEIFQEESDTNFLASPLQTQKEKMPP
ncbi:hypothetical protein LDENG_00190190 [Lucifuga dentata]|nr:hypothetical protein LDENG_00190190 [Lucifuga dentata]